MQEDLDNLSPKADYNRRDFIVTSLAAGQSVTVAVQFSNPSNATINLTPEFYAGSFQ